MLEMTDREAYNFSRITTWRVGDLFAGVGGWTTGFRMNNYTENRPFNTLWAVDYWERAAAAHKANHPTVEMIVEDMRDLDPGTLEPVDIIVGSPPCPAFSSAKQAQPKDIEAGLELVNAFFKVVNYIKPTFWAMENVKTFRGHIKHIKGLPNDARHFIMKGTDYRLPQRRERCIVTNLKQEPKINLNIINIWDVVNSLYLPGEEPSTRVFDILYPDHHDLIYPTPLEDGVNVNRHDLYEVKEKHIGMLYRKKRLKRNAGRVPFPDPIDKTARTILAKPSPTGRETIVIEDPRYRPYKLRYLSLREQAILQGFPVGYHFPDNTRTHTQVMIGNAFPPPMAKAIAGRMWVEQV
jgi:DNA (cytosine-5)-methyltransferase 1